MVKAHLSEGAEFGFGKAHAMGIAVFGGEVGVEHGGIVGGEGDGDAMAKKFWKRVRLDLGVLL